MYAGSSVITGVESSGAIGPVRGNIQIALFGVPASGQTGQIIGGQLISGVQGNGVAGSIAVTNTSVLLTGAAASGVIGPMSFWTPVDDSQVITWVVVPTPV